MSLNLEDFPDTKAWTVEMKAANALAMTFATIMTTTMDSSTRGALAGMVTYMQVLHRMELDLDDSMDTRLLQGILLFLAGLPESEAEGTVCYLLEKYDVKKELAEMEARIKFEETPPDAPSH